MIPYFKNKNIFIDSSEKSSSGIGDNNTNLQNLLFCLNEKHMKGSLLDSDDFNSEICKLEESKVKEMLNNVHENDPCNESIFLVM